MRRQTEEAMKHGFPTTWEPLPRPRFVSGVGDNAKTCHHEATIPGKLDNGEIMRYKACVIPGNPSPLPPLYGLDSMAHMNTYMGTRSGLMAMVPEGKDEEIKWPAGTKFMQCVRAPSRHWLIKVSNWRETAETFGVSSGTQCEPTPAAAEPH